MEDLPSVEDALFVTEFKLAKESRSHPLLLMLAGHHDTTIVIEVACNTSTPASVLERLSLHEDAAVRQFLCDNPSTPLETVQNLTLDSDGEVAKAAYRRLGITY